MLNIIHAPGNVTGDGTAIVWSACAMDRRHLDEYTHHRMGCLDAPEEINTGRTRHSPGFEFSNGERVPPYQFQAFMRRG